MKIVGIKIGQYNTDYIGWGYGEEPNLSVVSDYLISRGFVKFSDHMYEVPEKYSKDGKYEQMSIHIYDVIPWNQSRSHPLYNKGFGTHIARAIAHGKITDRLTKELDEILLKVAGNVN